MNPYSDSSSLERTAPDREDARSGDRSPASANASSERVPDSLEAWELAAIRRLAGGITHEFNNVVTVMLGYVSKLRKTFPDDAEAGARLGAIDDAARNAASLCRQLRLVADPNGSTAKPLDLNALVVDSSAAVRAALGRQTELRTAIDPSPLAAIVPPSGLTFLICSLAREAQHAAGPGGAIILQTRTETIGDGAPEHVSRLDPGDYAVVSVHATRGQTAEPVPLDAVLAEASALARHYGLRVAPARHPDTVAGFDIYVPASGASEPDPAGCLKSGHSGSPTILLAEDDEAVRSLATAILRDAGYTVVPAESGTAALDVLERYARPVDVLLTDVIMPGMIGTRLAEEVRRRFPAVRVVYMTGYPRDAFGNRVFADRGAQLVQKPFTEESLLDSIRQAIVNPSAPCPPAGMRTVLLVEDESAIRELIADSLRKLGRAVRTASNGAEAFQTLKQESCDILMTDIVMPYGDGIELSVEARRLYPRLKVIGITGAPQVPEFVAGFERFDRVIKKPVSEAALASGLSVN